MLLTVGILNSLILDMIEIKGIKAEEQVNVKMSISISKSSIIVCIKYPKIKNICKLCKTTAVAQNDGKLQIENEIINCENKFHSAKFCKKELNNVFCMFKYNNRLNLIITTLIAQK